MIPRRGARHDDPQTGVAHSGVRGIGTASLLADLGHEVPTALLPSFLTTTLGAPAAALGVIEGVSDGLAAGLVSAAARLPTTLIADALRPSAATRRPPSCPG